MAILHFSGVIRNVQYESFVRTRKLKRYAFEEFNINQNASYGIIELGDDNLLGYSKWVSPKRTRSYPFTRIYNTYHLPKRLTVIPIIKDEGLGGDNDRINFITLSWMNLMDVYVVLAWYDKEQSHPTRQDKITNQKFDNQYVREKVLEINQNKKSALHWNVMHFERDFVDVYRRAVESYMRIGSENNCRMHSPQSHLAVLEQYVVDDIFSRQAFADISLPRSYSAAQRESLTLHQLEFLGDGDKAYFELENLLGGKYHLTADEVFWENQTLVIQESKNSTRDKLPSLSDIQDGLSKGILFRNIDELFLNDVKVEFVTRLKLTGNVDSSINLPTDEKSIDEFAQQNHFSTAKKRILHLLNEEATNNRKLHIQVTGNL